MSEANQFETQQVTTKEFKEIPLDLIDDPARPMRSDLNRENIEDLVKSIRQVGLIEPIIVKKNGKRYEVIAGHRRTVASEYAGLAVVPCHIVEVTNDQAEMMKIHENLYRVDISPIDEASHYSYLIEKQKLTPTKVAQLISRNPKYVTDRLDIIDYDPELRTALEKGFINFSVAKEFNRIEDPAKLRQYLTYAVRGGMTAGVAKKWVDDLQKPVADVQQFQASPMADSDFVQPNEQTSKCFFCTEAVKLLEAHVVYVHDHCVTERMAQVEDDPPQA